jgi:hypothetical protein
MYVTVERLVSSIDAGFIVRYSIYINVTALKRTSPFMYSLIYDVYNDVIKNICVLSFTTPAFLQVIISMTELVCYRFYTYDAMLTRKCFCAMQLTIQTWQQNRWHE